AGGTASPLTTIAGQIRSGYNGGGWNGVGISSSVAAANATSEHKTGLGYAEATDIGLAGGFFAGQPVDDSAAFVRYTLIGDANLDLGVDLTDFTYLAANFN